MRTPEQVKTRLESFGTMAKWACGNCGCCAYLHTGYGMISGSFEGQKCRAKKCGCTKWTATSKAPGVPRTRGVSA